MISKILFTLISSIVISNVSSNRNYFNVNKNNQIAETANNKNILILLNEPLAFENSKNYEFQTKVIEFEYINELANLASFTSDANNEEIEVFNFAKLEKENTYSFNLKGIKEGSYSFNLKYDEEIISSYNVEVIKSYFNDADEEITKINSKRLFNSYKFDYMLYKDVDYSNILNRELDFEIIENENEVIEEAINLTLTYGKTYRTGNNVGDATLLVKYSPSGKKGFEVSKKVLIHVVENEDYLNVYKLNEEDELEEIEELSFEFEPFKKESLYVGNKLEYFDPKDIEIKDYVKTSSLFNYLDLVPDYSFGYPLLRIDLILNEVSDIRAFQIGIKDFNEIKKLFSFKSLESIYDIEINHLKFATSYIYNSINVESLIKEENAITIKKDNELIDLSVETIEANNPEVKLGLQALKVKFTNLNLELVIFFKYSMSPSFNSNKDLVTTSVKVSLFKDLLLYVNNSRPYFYSLKEAYNDLEYEYLKSLDENAKTLLTEDEEFVKEYKSFILKNEFDKAFFDEIDISFSISRYVFPTGIAIIIIIVFGVLLGSTLFYVYKRKGREEE